MSEEKIPFRPQENERIRPSSLQLRVENSEAIVEGLEEGHHVTFLARDRLRGDSYYVVTATDDQDLSSYRLHLGLEDGTFFEAKIVDYARYRDGGSVKIDYEFGGSKGDIYFPNRHNETRNPTNCYNGVVSQLEKIK